MKLKKKSESKLSSLTSKKSKQTEESSSSSSPSTSWLSRGDDIRTQLANAKLNSSRTYAPEIYVKDGESKRLRFRKSKAIAGVWRYSIKINGKWTMVTAPGQDQDDLMREAGMKPQFRTIYEVIDIDGYETKDGKKVKMIPRFFVANVKQEDQLEHMRKKRGDLTSYNIEIRREGSGTKTVYTLFPEDKEPLKGMDKVQTIEKDFAKYYAPPSLQEQRHFVANAEPDDN